MTTKREKYWVLRRGTRNIWFKEYGPIGLRNTLVESEAMRFKSKEEALRSEAYLHPIFYYKPEPVR